MDDIVVRPIAVVNLIDPPGYDLPQTTRTFHGGTAMVEEKDGWFVKNVKDATWMHTPAFGTVAAFDVGNSFPETGIHVFVIEPGKPNCRYHRESAQEDFLVLSGRCTALVNGEEHPLDTWDLFHCPAGVSHVLVGAGDGPCAVLAIGHRPGRDKHELFYPESELARKYNAESPEPTPEPRVAYSDVEPRAEAPAPDWPIGSNRS